LVRLLAESSSQITGDVLNGLTAASISKHEVITIIWLHPNHLFLPTCGFKSLPLACKNEEGCTVSWLGSKQRLAFATHAQALQLLQR
jgi:hypothetical protein